MLGMIIKMGRFALSAVLAMAFLLVAGSLLSAAPAKPAAKAPAAGKAPIAAKPAVSPAVKAQAQAKRGLKEGFANLKKGRAKRAAAVFTKLLSNGGMAPNDTARALLGRAQAYQKLKKTAQAIADYSSALWMRKGLVPDEKSAALRGRAQAYRAVGLIAQAQADTKAAGQKIVKAAPPPRKPTEWKTTPVVTPRPRKVVKVVPPRQLRITAKPPATRVGSAGRPALQPKKAKPIAAGWGAVPMAPATPPASSGQGFLSGLFGNLVSGVSKAFNPTVAASPPTPQATPQITTGAVPDVKRQIVRAPKRSPSSTPRIATAWAKGTAVKPQAKAVPRRALKVAAPSGNHDVQLDNLRSESAAEVMASRIFGSHAALLASRRAVVDSHVLRDMGTFYRVRIGPFRNARAGRTFCQQLRAKEKRIDCFGIVH